MTNNEAIGKKLKQLRVGRGLTQQQISEYLGLSRATISNQEIGRKAISVEKLKMLAKFYNVDLNFFYGETEEISKNDVICLLERAKELFKNEYISDKEKDKLYQQIMKIYLETKAI